MGTATMRFGEGIIVSGSSTQLYVSGNVKINSLAEPEIQFQIGKATNNSIIIAEAKETLFCLNLSVLVIVGVGVNYFTDLWYFDPIAALLMIPWLLYEFSQHK